MVSGNGSQAQFVYDGAVTSTNPHSEGANFNSGKITISPIDGNFTSNELSTYQTLSSLLGTQFGQPSPGYSLSANRQGGNTIDLLVPAALTAAQGTSGLDTVLYSGTGSIMLPGDIENLNLIGNGNNKVVSNALNNLIGAGPGSDLIYGNQGADIIYGNQGADSLFGGQGADRLFGGQGNDVAFGNLGDDVLLGNLGDDQLYGNQGQDTLFGNQGQDRLFGGQDADALYGGQDADIVYGNLGSDLIYGNQGSDSLYGGQGDDRLFGGQGNDLLFGNLGNDTLSGNLGADRFVFGQNSGNDLVRDFVQSDGDRLDLQGQTFVLGTAADGSAVLNLSGGGTVDLAGVQVSQVGAGSFA